MFNFDPDTHTFTIDGQRVPSITQVLKAEGFIESGPWFDQWSLDRGSAVHLACHLDDMDDLAEESIDPVIMPYLEAWREFRRISGIVIEGSEVPMVNESSMFGGIPDRWGWIGNARVVIDLKSGPCAPWVGLQTAAQSLLIDPTAHFKRFGLTLKGGKPKITEFTERTDRGVFLAALCTYNWKRNNIKGYLNESN